MIFIKYHIIEIFVDEDVPYRPIIGVFTSDSQIKSLNTVISDCEKGVEVYTLSKSQASTRVYVMSRGDKKFIRTNQNKYKEDNLRELSAA